MTIKQVQVAAVERRARQAVARRLGYVPADAVQSVTRDPERRTTVLLHLNSGGNSLACERVLRDRGYDVADLGAAPSGYGVLLRVGPTVRGAL